MNRAQLALLGGALALVAGLIRFADLTPQVESDFFFAQDDPQVQESAEISRRFPGGSQIIIRVASDSIESAEYRDHIDTLTDSLNTLAAVTGVNSIATADAFNGPLWGRLLVTPDRRATNVIIEFSTPDEAAFVTTVESLLVAWDPPGLEVQTSGVPYVIELIRRNLFRDLVTFSSAAIVVFALVMWMLYRSASIVFGTVASCLTASVLTIALSQLLGIGVGLLTANLATIVFVLTLSHIVFLTGNWERVRADPDAVRSAIRETLEASFWSMATTLLGFLSLLLATAKPLRELGVAGALGTAVAIGVAYLMYPVFLRGAGSGVRGAAAVNREPGTGNRTPWAAMQTHRHGVLAALLVLGVVMAFGVPRLSTDPSLISYFKPGTPLHEGLARIDADGGSSPLNIVVRDAGGSRLDRDSVVERMWRLQEELESDPATGVILSPPVFLAEARRAPFMGRLTWEQLLNVPLVARPAASFIHDDREQGLFFLRMREGGRIEARASVVQRIENMVRKHGMEPELSGDLYELQGKLGELIRSSLKIGLGGLLVLFALIGFVVSRSGPTTGLMVLCLVFIPSAVLGTFGYAGIAIDIITSPAANVALAMGVDSMIHLVIRVRNLSGTEVAPWATARQQLLRPVLSATLIIGTGFGIFALSTFPPTQRFGVAVIVGTLAAATMTLVALPLAAGRAGGAGSAS